MKFDKKLKSPDSSDLSVNVGLDDLEDADESNLMHKFFNEKTQPK